MKPDSRPIRDQGEISKSAQQKIEVPVSPKTEIPPPTVEPDIYLVSDGNAFFLHTDDQTLLCVPLYVNDPAAIDWDDAIEVDMNRIDRDVWLRASRIRRALQGLIR